jgi:hypothetical protein
VNKKVYSNTTKLELAVTTGDQNCAIENKIEDCKPTSNKNGVLSFNVKRTAGSRTTFQYIVGINYGSGGSNPENIISPTQFAISGTDTRIEIPITFPDISAKTVGAGSFLPITFRQDDTSTAAYTLEFNDIQLELGSVATDFEHRSYGEELALCQRYYYLHASGASSFIGIGTFISATQMRTLVYFPVTMRSEPTLEQVTGTDYFNIEYGSSDSFDNFSAIVTNGVNGTALYKTGMTSTTAGYSGVVRGLNASSQLAFDAEL